jgi:hypothetical protein
MHLFYHTHIKQDPLVSRKLRDPAQKTDLEGPGWKQNYLCLIPGDSDVFGNHEI